MEDCALPLATIVDFDEASCHVVGSRVLLLTFQRIKGASSNSQLEIVTLSPTALKELGPAHDYKGELEEILPWLNLLVRS